MRDVRLKGYYIAGYPQRVAQLQLLGIPLTPAEHRFALLTPEQRAAAAAREALIAQLPPADALLLRRGTRNAAKLQQLLAALRRFREISGPVGSVRVNFVVPSGESDWPEELWGVKLGKRLQEVNRGRIKVHLYGAAVCAAFEALGVRIPSAADAASSSTASSEQSSSSSTSGSEGSSKRSGGSSTGAERTTSSGSGSISSETSSDSSGSELSVTAANSS
jgi:hypothetical protein